MVIYSLPCTVKLCSIHYRTIMHFHTFLICSMHFYDFYVCLLYHRYNTEYGSVLYLCLYTPVSPLVKLQRTYCLFPVDVFLQGTACSCYMNDPDSAAYTACVEYILRNPA